MAAGRRVPARQPDLGDGGYAGKLVTRAAGRTVQIVKRPDNLHAFKVLPRRWVVGRASGWIMKYRRCVRDHERLPERHETYLYWSMITVMGRRVARHRRTNVTPPAAPPCRAPHEVPKQALSDHFDTLTRRVTGFNPSTAHCISACPRLLYPQKAAEVPTRRLRARAAARSTIAGSSHLGGSFRVSLRRIELIPSVTLSAVTISAETARIAARSLSETSRHRRGGVCLGTGDLLTCSGPRAASG